MIRALGLLACVLVVACSERVEDYQIAAPQVDGNKLRGDYGQTGSGPAGVAPYLKAKAAECGRLYAVVNLDGSIRCAQLVPGIVWQPYIDAKHEDEARLKYLKQLPRREK